MQKTPIKVKKVSAYDKAQNVKPTTTALDINIDNPAPIQSPVADLNTQVAAPSIEPIFDEINAQVIEQNAKSILQQTISDLSQSAPQQDSTMVEPIIATMQLADEPVDDATINQLKTIFGEDLKAAIIDEAHLKEVAKRKAEPYKINKIIDTDLLSKIRILPELPPSELVKRSQIVRWETLDDLLKSTYLEMTKINPPKLVQFTNAPTGFKFNSEAHQIALRTDALKRILKPTEQELNDLYAALAREAEEADLKEIFRKSIQQKLLEETELEASVHKTAETFVQATQSPTSLTTTSIEKTQTQSSTSTPSISNNRKSIEQLREALAQTEKRIIQKPKTITNTNKQIQNDYLSPIQIFNGLILSFYDVLQEDVLQSLKFLYKNKFTILLAISHLIGIGLMTMTLAAVIGGGQLVGFAKHLLYIGSFLTSSFLWGSAYSVLSNFKRRIKKPTLIKK